MLKARAFVCKSETRSREPSENGSVKHSNRCNYTNQLSILQAYIAINQINIEEKLNQACKGQNQINTVIFTRFNTTIDSPLKCIEQIQLFNFIKKKFGPKILKINIVGILNGSIDAEE